MSPAPRIDPVVRFWRRVEPTDGCWEWSGDILRNGYGRLTIVGKTVMAHRFSWEMHRGPIPDGLQIDHLCRNRRCVRPDHLEPVTPRENTRRAEPANRTHCPHGHEYSAENTLIRRCGRRMCRACGRDRNRARRAQLVATIPGTDES